MLYFDLRPVQKCHSKVMHRKEMTHSNGNYERKSRGRKLADEIGRTKKNSHGTLIVLFFLVGLKTESSKPTRKNKTVETALRKPTKKHTENNT